MINFITMLTDKNRLFYTIFIIYDIYKNTKKITPYAERDFINQAINYSRSIAKASPIPPPTHKVATPLDLLLAIIS